MFDKEIVYDPESRDFALYLNGELVGYARTYFHGETTLDQLVYDRLMHSAPVVEEESEAA